VNTAKENNVVFALAHFVYICKYFPVKTDKYIYKKNFTKTWTSQIKLL